jgi:hypothetical protein
MIREAKQLGADQASIIVKKSNEAQYARTMREAFEEGSQWTYAGDVWYPSPGYGYFVWSLRDEEPTDDTGGSPPAEHPAPPAHGEDDSRPARRT